MNALRATSHLGAAAVYDEKDYSGVSDVYYEDDDYLPLLGVGSGGAHFADDEDEEQPSGGTTWPPKLNEWKDNSDSVPEISFNAAIKGTWEQTKKEVYFLRKKYGMGMDGLDNFMERVYGKDSRLFSKFKLIGIDSFYDYNKFLATFFCECRYGKTYQRLYNDQRVNTSDLLEPKEYLQFWRKIDDYHKFATYSPRAWKELEDAFNDAMSTFIPQTEEDRFCLQVTYDDDKQHYNSTVRFEDRPHDENQTLKSVRHTRDNVQGQVVDAMVYTGSGLPVHIHYRRKGESETSSFKKAVQRMFGFEEGMTPPNLHGRVVFAADRGYWNSGIAHWILSLGADIFGTVKRMFWWPFSYGKQPPTKQSEKNKDQVFIPVQQAPCLFMKTVRHNLGKPGPKSMQLTATAWRNQTSSAVPMTISSQTHRAEYDLVFSTPKEAMGYERDLNRMQRFMTAFKPVVGDTDGNGQKLHYDALAKVVRPLTTEQRNAIWFLCRRFALTSSTNDGAIRSLAKTITRSSGIYSDLKKILFYAGWEDLLQQSGSSSGEDEDIDDYDEVDYLEEDEDDSSTFSLTDDLCDKVARDDDTNGPRFALSDPMDEDEEVLAPDAAASPAVAAAEDTGEVDADDKGGSLLDAESAISSSSSSSSDDTSDSGNDGEDNDPIINGEDQFLDLSPDTFLNQFCCDSQQKGFEKIRKEEACDIVAVVSNDFVLTCLDQLGWKRKSTVSEEGRRQLLLDWTQSSRAERAVAFLTRDELLQLKEDHGLQIKSTAGKVDAVRKRIADALQRKYYPEDCPSDEQDDDSIDFYDEEAGEDCLVDILKSAFMRPRKKGSEEGQNEYAKRGLQMETKFLKQFREIVNSSTTYPPNVSTIYNPGLVSKTGEQASFIRDSADGVGMFNGDSVAVPIEVKSRNSVRTIHKERNIIWNWIERDEDDVKCHDHGGDSKVLFAEFPAQKNGRCHPLLRHCIPDPHERIQLLHHAYTYKSKRVFFVVGNDKDVMAIYRVKYEKEFLLCYGNVCRNIFNSELAWLYKPRESFPEIPESWKTAITRKALKGYKLDLDSLKSNLMLWWAINVEKEDYLRDELQFEWQLDQTVKFPIGDIKRILPLPFSQWNAAKSGGDTITKLLDSIQERVALRTENTVASARALQYHSVSTHRTKQWLTAKEDLDFYPSLSHARKANNARVTLDDSLDYMISTFLSWADQSRYVGVGLDSIEADMLSNDDLDAINNFFPINGADGSSSSAAGREGRSTRANKTPIPVDMPFATLQTNKTPKHHGKANVPAAHQLRCDLCLGFPYGQLVEFQSEKKSARGNGSTPQKKEIKRKCAYCGRTTDYFCQGCSRYLCNSAPKVENNKKHPKYFRTRTPVMGSNGDLLTNSNGSFHYVERLTKWTCHNAAHLNGYRLMLGQRRAELINIARGIAPGAGGDEDMEADANERGIAIQSNAAAAAGEDTSAPVLVTARKRAKRKVSGS